MIKFNLELFEKANCSRDDKKECIDLIRSLISFSELTRKHGLIALEDIFDFINDPFLLKLLKLIADGIDYDIVYSIGITLINASFKSGLELLRSMITLDGVLTIYNGEKTELVEVILVSYLGSSSNLYDEYKIGKYDNKLIETDNTDDIKSEKMDYLTTIENIKKNIKY